MPSTQDKTVPKADLEVLKQFQLLTSTKDKSDPAWGAAVMKYIGYTTYASIGNGYFWIRNTRFKQNRDIAAGKQPARKFMDMLNFNGKTNYINMNWQANKIANSIISRIVGRWMSRREKIVVSATDSLSIRDKEDQYRQAEFVMNHRQQLQDLQDQSGVQMIPNNQYIPQDYDELNLWFAEYARIAEEILYEKGINDVMAANGLFDDVKEMLCQDSAQVGLPATYTWMDEDGVIKIDWVKPENYFYSYSERNDMSDTTWRGRVVGMKISEIRKRWGVEFGGHLTEEELWQLAENAKEYQLYDKLRWLVEWNVAILRPYDEWNVDVLHIEIRTVDEDPYTLVTTKKNKSTIIKKGGNPNKMSDNEEFVQMKRNSIYEGYYVKNLEKVLYWGLKTNMIRPQDPKQCGDALFGFSSYMYQNQDMKNVAVPEKIQPQVEEMSAILYRIQQCIMSAIPPGAAINWTAMQELEMGLGDDGNPIDPEKLYRQTGRLYYNGFDAEGKPIPVPITELTNSGFLPQIQGYIQAYEFQYKVLTDQLGEDPQLMTKAVAPRVAEGNVQAANESASNATDFMYDAYLYVMEETAKKVACLLHTSVDFGAQAYRHIMGEEDIKGRQFATKIQMLPTDQELVNLSEFMNQALQSNPQLIMFLDPAKVMRIAKDDVKLAEWYMRQCQKKMWQAQQQQEQQNQQATFQAQAQQAQQSQQAQIQIEQLKAQYEQQKTADLSKADKEKILLTGFTNMWAAGVVVPPELKGVESELIKNVVLPLFAENQANARALGQAMVLHQAMDAQDNQQQDQEDQMNQPYDPSQQQNNQPPQAQQQAA